MGTVKTQRSATKAKKELTAPTFTAAKTNLDQTVVVAVARMGTALDLVTCRLCFRVRSHTELIAFILLIGSWPIIK